MYLLPLGKFWPEKSVHSIRFPKPAMWWSVPVRIIARVGLRDPLVDARYQRRASLRTSGCRVKAGETDAISRELVDVGCLNLASKTSRIREAEVVSDDD